ncbi:hypothetical protein BDA99DRAFT_575161 [Phascolomyces articulosus]|uniref:RING-type domain-containing protein n=1 Tax=Phascolomyces articulosus TaxID=60185 RepID=A0AAD5P9P4_9FUNG|nr:hypothetical protein BDA99DRAFT_575161 [Phascolomyces articulosus]
MVIKVVKKYQKIIRCCICLEDYYDTSLFFNDNNGNILPNQYATQATETETQPPPPSPILFAPENCNHHICQPCMEKYTLASLKQGNEDGMTNLMFVQCPEPECTQTYLLEELIAFALPLRQRMLFWFHNKIHILQQNLEKASLEEELRQQQLEQERQQQQKRRFNIKMKKRTSSSATVAAIAATAAASPSSALFFEDGQKLNYNNKKATDKIVKMALKNNWTRCPQCKYLVQRTRGCNHMSCPCGATFCYRCGSKCGADKNICNRNRENLREEMQKLLL